MTPTETQTMPLNAQLQTDNKVSLLQLVVVHGKIPSSGTVQAVHLRVVRMKECVGWRMENAEDQTTLAKHG